MLFVFKEFNPKIFMFSIAIPSSCFTSTGVLKSKYITVENPSIKVATHCDRYNPKS